MIAPEDRDSVVAGMTLIRRSGVYEHYYDDVVVARTTKTKIVLSNGEEFNRDGYPKSRSSRHRLHMPTDELREHIKYANETRQARIIIENTQFSKLSAKKMLEIAAIIQRYDDIPAQENLLQTELDNKFTFPKEEEPTC